MKKLSLLSVLAVVGSSATAEAFMTQCQWFYRIGPGVDSTFMPVTPGGVMVPGGTTAVRLRLRFGVFDDAGGPAPAGGFVGWNVGTLLASGDCCQSLSRTPGRLSPFTFAPNPPGNGLPTADPVPCGTTITAIDCTLGTQSPAWGCTAPPNQVPAPQPGPVTRGLNTLISIYEVTLALNATGTSATVTAAGNSVVATGWGTIGMPIPPDCGDPSDPADDTPGSVTYAPMTLPPTAFTCSATVICIPSPAGAGVLLGLAGLVAIRRRRQ